jgi:citrate lyase subunit beta/citryl-CoA lyase
MEIATSSPDVVAIAIGLEDYTADLGVQRTLEGKESLYARMRLVNAARAAGIQPIDSVFSDVADMKGLEANVSVSKTLGFEGMGCIHPRQIDVIKKGFLPAEEEIEKAKKIFIAYEEAIANGLGVVSLGSKMIDPPVVKRALRTIDLAVGTGILNSDWISESEE